MENTEWFNSDLGFTLHVSDHQAEIPTTDQTHPPHWRVPRPNPECSDNNSDAESNDDEAVANSDSDFIPSEQEDEDGGPIPPPEQKRKRGRPPNSKNKATLTRDSNTKTASNICKTCNKSFTAFSSLQRHELTHSDNTHRFSCEECGKKFTQKPSLVHHIKSQHVGELNFPCGHCDKIYVRNIDLQGHIRRCHQLGPQLRQKCPECKKEYVNLKKHIREVHKAKEKPRKHKCNICDKSFNSPYDLGRHVKLHNKTAYESFSCPHCPLKFLEKPKLDVHISRTHLMEKKIASKYCGNKFRYWGCQKKHDEIHETQGICSKVGLRRKKLFACEFCPERVESEYLLKLHMNNTHPEPRLVLKKMIVQNISLKENPDSGLFLVRPEKEEKDSGSVCAWHLCLKCGTAFLDLNRARKHNNSCVVVPHQTKSEEILIRPTATASMLSGNENYNIKNGDPRIPDRDRHIGPLLTSTLGPLESKSGLPTALQVVLDHPNSVESSIKPARKTASLKSENEHRNDNTNGQCIIPDRDLHPPLTSSVSFSTPAEAEIINSDDDDEGAFGDFEGALTEGDVTDIIFNSSIDADDPNLTTPAATQTEISETTEHLGNSNMVEDGGQWETDHFEAPSVAPTAPKPARPDTPMSAPSIPGAAEKKKSKLPAALRATTPWQEKHMNVVLSSPKPFQCKTCLQFYSSKTCLLSHVRVHAEPEHCCEFCGKRFAKKQVWIYHVRTHTGEKPHKCKFCDFRAVTPMEIYSHERIHDKTEDGVRKKREMTEHKKKICTCAVCGKTFADAHHCRNHMYFQHEYDPKNGKGLPYTCKTCKKTFAYKSNTNAHVKSAHPDELEEALGRGENPSRMHKSKIYANFISVDKSLLAPKSVNPANGRRGRPNSGEENGDDSNFEDLSSLITH